MPRSTRARETIFYRRRCRAAAKAMAGQEVGAVRWPSGTRLCVRRQTIGTLQLRPPACQHKQGLAKSVNSEDQKRNRQESDRQTHSGGELIPESKRVMLVPAPQGALASYDCMN